MNMTIDNYYTIWKIYYILRGLCDKLLFLLLGGLFGLVMLTFGISTLDVVHNITVATLLDLSSFGVIEVPDGGVIFLVVVFTVAGVDILLAVACLILGCILSKFKKQFGRCHINIELYKKENNNNTDDVK